MGNNHSNQSSSSNLNGLSRTRSIVRRSKKKSTKRSSKSLLSTHEAFFIAHHKAQQAAALANGVAAGESSPISPITPSIHSTENQIDLRKRVIFVSLMGLYQSWKNVPSTILYSSIFLLPLKKQWVYSSEKYNYQHDFQHVLTDSNFVKLLKWKDAQGLVFWMRDGVPSNELKKCITPTTPDFIADDDDDDDNCQWMDNDNTNYDVDIAPFWRYLSMKLSSLYDPMTGNNYNPLQLDYKWWQTNLLNGSHDKESTFHASIDQIRKELYFLTMKFKSMSQLLCQSNKTLNVVTIYTLNVDHNGDSTNNTMNNGSIRSRETSQKSYNSLPDHVLCEMAEDISRYQIDVDAPCAVQQLNLNGEITPNPNDNNNNVNNDIDVEDEENIWWVSTEYDEVMAVHDDELYGEEQEGDDEDYNDNPLLTPRRKVRENEQGNDSVLIISDRATI